MPASQFSPKYRAQYMVNIVNIQGWYRANIGPWEAPSLPLWASRGFRAENPMSFCKGIIFLFFSLEILQTFIIFRAYRATLGSIGK